MGHGQVGTADPVPGPGTGSARKLVTMVLGDRPALVVEGGRTYDRSQLVQAVARCASRLRAAGARPGQRVLALLDHDVTGVVFLAAASALGLRLLMPYNLRAAAVPEWRSIAAAARPDLVVYLRRDTAPAAELGAVVLPHIADDRTPATMPAPHPDPVDGFLVLFTSGTTGSPKAISISEELVCRRVWSVSTRLAFGADARVYLSGLLNNTTGVFFAFGALAHGATLVVPDGRDVASWPAQVAAHDVTHLMLRPVAMKTFVESASATGADLSSVRVVAYGAAPMPRAVLAAGRRLMRCDWVQGYGLSETYGPFCWLDEAAHRDGRHLRDAYCVGRPDETLEVTLLPVDGHRPGIGEVAVRGGALMDGYYDVASGRIDPPPEWLRTGDLGEWSAEGDLVLKGRRSGSVLSADGHRIYPEEAEAALAEVPGVDEAVLVGVAGTDGIGERPVACLSGPLARQAPVAARATLVAALTPRLSREKWPDLVHLSESPFPKSDNDKVMRARVVESIDHAALIEL